jgi:hypothetical protein
MAGCSRTSSSRARSSSAWSASGFWGRTRLDKTVWTPKAHERRVLQACAPTPAGLAERVAYAYGRPLARRVLRR